METLISLTEVGRILGVSRQRASQIADEHADFPAPAAQIPSGRAWRPADIEAWAQAHPDRQPGRPKTPLGERLRRLRAQGGYQPEFMDTELGLALDGWLAFEEGESVPSADILRRAAAVLAVHPAVLLDTAGYAREAEQARLDHGWNAEPSRKRLKAAEEELRRQGRDNA